MIFFYAVEDELSGEVARRLLYRCFGDDVDARQLGRAQGGYGHIRSRMRKYAGLATTYPVLIITDLDSHQCAPSLSSDWLETCGMNEWPDSLAFCVAVREVEALLLADRDTFAEFISITPDVIDRNVEENVADPKAYLIQLARRARRRELRDDLVPARNNVAKVGIGYNRRLTSYVRDMWRIDSAAENNRSLFRAIQKLSVPAER